MGQVIVMTKKSNIIMVVHNEAIIMFSMEEFLVLLFFLFVSVSVLFH